MKKHSLVACASICMGMLVAPAAYANCDHCVRVSATDQMCWSGESGGTWAGCWEEQIFDEQGTLVRDRCQGAQCEEEPVDPVDSSPNKKFQNLVILDSSGNPVTMCTATMDADGIIQACDTGCDICVGTPWIWY